MRDGIRWLGRRGTELVVLGEVCEGDVVDLRSEVAASFPKARKPASSSAHPSDVGVLTAATCAAGLLRSLKTGFKGKNLDGRQVCFRVRTSVAGADAITFFAAHWPSRRESLGEAEREHLGADLARKVSGAKGGVIVIGDFNDEPFNKSLSDSLQSTRMRETARKRSILYNPFWRLLGERRPFEAEDDGGLCGGTHRWSGDYGGEWFTLDQMLFSPRFLSPNGWRLREGSIDIVELRGLKTGQHFPIMCTLEFAG